MAASDDAVLRGAEVVDGAGHVLGRVEAVFHDATGAIAWLGVRVAHPAGHAPGRLVGMPAAGSGPVAGGRLGVGWEPFRVHEAPEVTGSTISEVDEQRLATWYGLGATSPA